MQIPTLLFRIFDPAEAYFRTVSPVAPGPVHRGAAFLSPAGSGEGRQVPEAEFEAPEHSARRARRAEVDEDAVRRQYGDELRSKAIEVLAGAQVTFTCPGGRLECRIIRFWRGDSLLEIDQYDATGQNRGRSLGRVGGSRSTNVDAVTHYLVFRVAELLGG